MKAKDKVNKLDDIGFVGVQQNQSAASKAYHIKKTGEAIRQLKKATKNRGNNKTAAAR